MRIARNRIVLEIPETSEELRAQIAAANKAGDTRGAMNLDNRLQIKLAEEAGGIPTVLQKRCVCRYGYEGFPGWYFSPWSAAQAFNDRAEK